MQPSQMAAELAPFAKVDSWPLADPRTGNLGLLLIPVHDLRSLRRTKNASADATDAS